MLKIYSKCKIVCEKCWNTVAAYVFQGWRIWWKWRRQCWIQHFDTHAPCWNTVEMCVRIRQFPSALRVFSAGTQYFFKENSARGNAGIQWKICWNTVKKSVENSWECWTIRKTGSQNTSRFDTSMLKAACFTMVIFWKVRHYEAKSLFLHPMFTSWSHCCYDIFFVIFYTCLVLEYRLLQFARFSKVRKFTRKLPGASFRINVFSR